MSTLAAILLGVASGFLLGVALTLHILTTWGD